jgi:hypothetical protein
MGAAYSTVSTQQQQQRQQQQGMGLTMSQAPHQLLLLQLLLAHRLYWPQSLLMQ